MLACLCRIEEPGQDDLRAPHPHPHRSIRFECGPASKQTQAEQPQCALPEMVSGLANPAISSYYYHQAGIIVRPAGRRPWASSSGGSSGNSNRSRMSSGAGGGPQGDAAGPQENPVLKW